LCNFEKFLVVIEVNEQYDEVLLYELFTSKNTDPNDVAALINRIEKFKSAKELNHYLEGWLDFTASAAAGKKIGPSPESKEATKAQVERSHDLGVKHGRAEAEKQELVGVGFDNPIKGGKFGQGFDDIMVHGGDLDNGLVYIVEYKGGSADLAPGQMSLAWVLGNIRRLHLEGGTSGKIWAQKLTIALRDGRLRRVVYKTPVDRGIPGVTTTDILPALPAYRLNLPNVP
jgi:hypothetical protein